MALKKSEKSRIRYRLWLFLNSNLHVAITEEQLDYHPQYHLDELKEYAGDVVNKLCTEKDAEQWETS